MGLTRRLVALALALAGAALLPAPAQAARRHHAPAARHAAPPAHRQVGLASYYSHRFSGRRMADGTRLHPGSDSAASRTLPLGTQARVTNLRNGRTAIVTIRDRGPHVRDRIIDVSPATARQLGLIEHGVARVEVTALRLPPPKR